MKSGIETRRVELFVDWDRDRDDQPRSNAPIFALALFLLMISWVLGRTGGPPAPPKGASGRPVVKVNAPASVPSWMQHGGLPGLKL